MADKFDELFSKTTYSKRKVLAGIVMMTGREALPRVISISTGNATAWSACVLLTRKIIL